MQNNITVPAASKRRVVDAFTRALHALMAVSFGLAYITSEVEGLRLVHVTMGYTLGAVFLIRVIWGVVGPRRVRLKGLTGRLGTLDHTLEMIKSFDWQGMVKLLLAVSMVTLLVCSMPVVASGYVTYLDWLGKWTKEVHETLGNVMLLAVGCHVGAVTLLSMGKTDRQVPHDHGLCCWQRTGLGEAQPRHGRPGHAAAGRQLLVMANVPVHP